MKIKEIKNKVNRIREINSQAINNFGLSKRLYLIEEIKDSLPYEIQQIELYHKGYLQYNNTAFFDWELYPDEMEYDEALEKYKNLKVLA